MATPTASYPTNPTSATKKVTGHVSTPTQFNFSSPAPRSVPSPATTRKDQAGKTPINHPTTGSSQGSKTLNNTPMLQSLSQQGHSFGSSPGAHMLGYGTPIGLGVDGITPSGLNMPTPGMGGLAMATSLSELGLTSAPSASKPNEDEQRKQRMRKVLKRIGSRTGRVSEEGIARVSRRVGFTNDIDAEQLTREQQERTVGNRKVAIAGNKVLVEVDLKNHVPQNVEVMYDTENAHLTGQADAAGKLLLHDLRASDGVYTSLDRFGTNLDRLARIDRLSSSHVNCFEALSGVHTSLERLYQAQKEVANELEVMCRQSGRPTMHSNGRLGLAIQYWRSDTKGLESETSDGMDLDGDKRTLVAEDADIFRLNIEVESSLAALYPSLRVSDDWLPTQLDSTMINGAESLPWQEPPPTIISATAADLETLPEMGSEKLPDLRFVAKLDPPVVMPWQVASTVMQSCGLPGIQPYINWQAWHSMVLEKDLPVSGTNSNAAIATADQVVLTMHQGEESEVLHSYSLDVAKPEIAVKLQELQFSHPKQIVEVLPVLRQWAQMDVLVRGALANAASATAVDSKKSQTGTASMSFEDLLGDSNQDILATDEKLRINIVLVTSPIPTLDLIFPSQTGDALMNYSLQVLPNAEYNVVDTSSTTDGAKSPDADGSDGTALAKALRDCGGELGVWVEWLRRR